jgi:hypothetical protein
MQSYSWTLNTITLLDELLDVLTKSVRSWGRFYSIDGGIGYFSDLAGTRFIENLNSTKKSFERLDCYREDLQSLKETVATFSAVIFTLNA